MKLNQITNTTLKEDISLGPMIFLIGSLYYFGGMLGQLMKDMADDEVSRKNRQKMIRTQLAYDEIRDQIKIKTQKIQQHFPGMGPEEIAEKAFQIIDDNRKKEIEQKVAVWADK